MKSANRRGAALLCGRWMVAIALLGLATREFVWTCDPRRLIIWVMPEFEKRFEAARSALPAQGTVQYISDSELGIPMREDERRAYMYLTQFVMVPLRLSRDARTKLVLADIISQDADKALRSSPAFEIVKEFGQGVFLVRSR